MKRFLLPLSAILLAVLSVPLFAESSANAASAYDNTVQLQEEPLTLSYFGNHSTTYSYDELIGEFQACALTDYTNFLIAETSPNGAVAVMQSYSGTDPRSVWFYYSLTGKDVTELQFASASSNTRLEFQSAYTSNDIKAVLMQKNSSGGVQCFTGYNESNIYSSGAYVAYKSTSLNVKPFLNQFPINYPAGYEGADIPSTAGAEVIRPRFTYDVVDRDVTATHVPRSSALPTYPNDQYSIEWFVRKCLDWDDTVNSCDEYEENNLHYEITPSGGTTSFQVPSYGHYKISAGYLIGGCTRFPSYPATPDYCYYTAPANTDDYEYTITAMMWDIDGTSFSGDTDDDSLICDVSGFCEPPPFNCADVYSDNFIMRLSCSMQQDMDFGIVNPSLFAIKDLMQSMTVSENPQCDIPLTNVSLAPGYTFPLASYSSVACARAAEVRTAIPILSVFLNFMLAMLSIWMVVRIINKLFDNNDHNIIEGV